MDVDIKFAEYKNGIGIIDNIRNYLLILLNQQIVSKNVDYNLLINLNGLKSETLIYQIYSNI